MRTKLDGAGRAVIPFQIRNIVQMKPGDEIEIEIQDRTLILKPLLDKCLLCGSTQEIEQVDGNPVCKRCLERIKAEFEGSN